MDSNIDNYDDISFESITKMIQLLSGMGNDEKTIMQLTSALGVYIQKLQKEYDYSPVFPQEILPLSKSKIKKWGYEYAYLAVKKEGELKQFQQDGALCFTRFQEISQTQWEAIKTRSIDSLTLYNADMRDKGFSEIIIPEEYKTIVNNYQKEYKSEVVKLHEYLRGRSQSEGCLKKSVILSIAGLIIFWLLVH